MRKMFGPIKNEVTEEWRELHYGETHDCKPTPWQILSGRRNKRLDGHIACMGEEKIRKKNWQENLKESDPWRTWE